VEPEPPTYPARPMNGGRLELAEPLEGEWRYRPKYNGRRVLLHVPTMRTWNRRLDPNNWVFPALARLREKIESEPLLKTTLEWLDLELLYGRTSVANRSVIVLDYISDKEVWWDRMVNLNIVFGEVALFHDDVPGDGQVRFSFPFKENLANLVWDNMQKQNKTLAATLFEGLVAYNTKAVYPIQLFSPGKETRHWIKYRFID
jgi:hypothetical protein